MTHSEIVLKKLNNTYKEIFLFVLYSDNHNIDLRTSMNERT